MADTYNVKLIFDLIDKATPGLNSIKSSMELLTEFGKGLASVLAVPITVGAFAAGIQQAINFGDELNKLSEKSGIAADALSGLAYAGQLSDMGLEQLTGSMKFLNQSLVESLDGSSKAAEAFRQIGVATTDATGKLRPAQDVLDDLAKKFSETKDDASKAALAIEIFSKAGLDMIPFLNQGKEKLAELKEEAKQFGIFWTPEQARSADEFNDNITRLTNVAKGLFAQIAQALLPTLIALSEELINSAKEGGTLKGVVDAIVGAFKVFDIVIRGVAIAINIVSNGFNLLGKFIGIVSAALVAFFSGDFASASRVFDELKAAVANTRLSITDFMDKMINAGNVTEESGKKTEKASIGYQKLSKEAKKAADDIDKLRLQVEKYISGLEASAEKALLVSEIEKKRVDLETRILEFRRQGLSEQEAINALNRGNAALELEKSNKDFVEQVKSEVDAMREANKTRIELENAKKDFIKTTEKETEQLEYENSLYGLSNEEKRVAIELRNLEIKSIAETGEVLDDLIQKRREALEEANRQRKEEQLLAGTYEVQRREFERNKAFLEGLYESGKISRKTLEEAIEKLPDEALNSQERTLKEMKQSMERAVASMQNIWSNGFFDWMQGKSVDLVGTIKQAVDRMVADMLAAQLQLLLFGDMGKGRSGDTGILGSIFGGIFGFGGWKAGGGMVEAGKAYVVGEKRPELFVPRSNGEILPSVGGNIVNLNITAMDSQDVRRALEKDKRWLSDLFTGTNRVYNLQGSR